jgi:membrane protein implicated in regulation of membrane protease activity
MVAMNDEPPPDDVRMRVPPYVALVRIAAVIAMSATAAAGILLLLLGSQYLLWGLLAIALAVPCFFVMRFVERTAETPEEPPTS